MKIEKDIALIHGKILLGFCRSNDAQKHHNIAKESIADLATRTKLLLNKTYF
ncbi:MAG: hypothetical protein PHE15_03210 [Dehalococcoidales bacterium]|nr:hypothetical protein [Dehalococcoidales bacterium]